MGFLDKLLKAGTTELTLQVEPDRVRAGGEVHVRWDLGGEIDDKDRTVRAGVTATGHYLAYDDERDSDGDRRREVEHREVEVWEHARDAPMQLGPGELVVRLPDDAPPGSAGVLKWTAWARVDRKGGKDDVEEATLYVRRPPAEDPPADEVAADGFVLRGIPRVVALNRTYEGTVDFTPPDDVKGQVKARLIRRCHFDARGSSESLPDLLGMPALPGRDLLERFASDGDRHDDTITREEVEVEVELSEAGEFAAGATRSFALQLPVPKKGPTTQHRHATVDWRLEVVLDRRMRGDLRVVLPLEVR